MKSKVTWPVIIALVTIGLTVSGEIMLLFSKISIAVQHGSWTDSAFNYVLYRIVFEITCIGIILYIVLNKNINQIVKPILQLTKDARSFKSDSYIYPIRDYEIEEVQELATAFDYMAEELGSTIRKLKHQKEKLETTLEALEEGIVVISRTGYIGQANELAKKMLQLPEDLKMKPKFIEVVKNTEVKRIIGEGLKNGGYQTIEIDLDEKIVFLNLVPIGDKKEAYEYLLVIRDVTKLRKLEAMRSEFVSNVSHELKTPLTSIQGFVETLQNGAIENPKVAYRFLDIIDIETKRLYRLIQDILLLSEIENMDEHQYSRANINKLLEETVMLVSPQAEKKGIALNLELDRTLNVENISEDHLKQLFMNLISNAIKYTDQGQVDVRLVDNKIIVKDTGIGIPEESIEHIFERFYRVDKSRSRQSGGTGLGLSIVKHIAQLYDITISVTSEVGVGSEFTLVIPKEYII